MMDNEAPLSDQTVTDVADVTSQPTEPVSVERETTIEEKIEAVAEKVERKHSRAPTGQFAKPQPAAQPLAAPKSWKAEYAARFGELPPDVQQYINQREAEAHSRISEMGQRLGGVGEMTQTFERYRPVYGAMGLNETQAFEHLMEAHNALEKNPEQAIRYLAQSYGIDLGRLAGRNPDVDSVLESFAKEKGDDWKVAEQDVHEQLDVVLRNEPHLTPQQALAKAWDKASRLNPTIADRAVAERRKAEDEERSKKAREAKRVGTLNVKSTAASPAKARTWEETLRAVGERVA